MLVQAATEMTLGNDGELRYTPGGHALWKARAVTSRRKKDDNDQWTDVDTTWYELTCWNQLAEHAAESLAVGMKVVVLGDVYNEEWEDKDGNKRYTLKVNVKSIGPSLAFATAKVSKVERSGSSGGGGQGQGQRQPTPAEDPWATPATTPASDEPPF